MTGISPRSRIRGFDGLRALAVIAVFLTHRSRLWTTGIGHNGVLVFFALSGFLIVGLLNDAKLKVEANGQSPGDALRDFFGRRTARIFPIYYLTLAVLGVIALLSHPVEGWRWNALPWNLAYLSNIYVGHVLHGWQGDLSHFWSLAVEEQFYLLVAPLLILIPASRHAMACAAIVGTGLASHLLQLANHAAGISLYTDSLTNFAFIALGGFLRLSTKGLHWRNAEMVAWLSGAAVLALAFFPDRLGGSEINLLITPALGALLVLSVAKAQNGPLVRFLELPPLAHLGRISYGFYIYHYLFWVPLFHAHDESVFGIAVNFAASVILAELSWLLIEQPIMLWGRGQLARSAIAVAA